MSLFYHYLSLPYLLKGIWFTIDVTLLGLLGGLAVGLMLASMQLSRFWLLSGLARGYTVIFRGTPLILQLVFVYDALPQFGLRLSSVVAAGVALSANEAPFIAEILRAGVKGVEAGQILAGQALGMTPGVLLRRVIAPQAIRTMVPALGNETISALKNSSLASVISVEELTLRSTQLASSTFDFFSIFFASGLIYLVLTGAVAVIQLIVEYALDLDRPSARGFLVRLAPWRTVAASVAPTRAAMDFERAPEREARTSFGDRSARLASIAANPIAIDVRELTKRYGGRVVLDGLDLEVKTGEVVALLGPSGSGKSTLLRCINRLESWDDGVVRVGGRRIGYRPDGRMLVAREVARERASLGVGMVFQQFNLFSHLSARENIAGPLRWVHGYSQEDARTRANALLARVGLMDRADALPRHMSGGQQQRVAIARALAPSPNVLLLDEPTSALDPELVNEVLDVIRRLAFEDGLTMLISTHQIRFALEVADRVAFLNGGTIIEEGSARDVLLAPRHPLTRKFLNVMGAEHPFQPSAVEGSA